MQTYKIYKITIRSGYGDNVVTDTILVSGNSFSTDANGILTVYSESGAVASFNSWDSIITQEE